MTDGDFVSSLLAEAPEVFSVARTSQVEAPEVTVFSLVRPLFLGRCLQHRSDLWGMLFSPH